MDRGSADAAAAANARAAQRCSAAAHGRAGDRRRARRFDRRGAARAPGATVTLLEKDRHPRFHIGESLLPANLPLFEQLGVADAGARHRHAEMGRRIRLPMGRPQPRLPLRRGLGQVDAVRLPGAALGVRRDPDPQRRAKRARRSSKAAACAASSSTRPASAAAVPQRPDRRRARGRQHAALAGALSGRCVRPRYLSRQPLAAPSGATRSTTARRSSATSPARSATPASAPATSSSSGSSTAGSGSSRCTTARPASARWAGRTTSSRARVPVRRLLPRHHRAVRRRCASACSDATLIDRREATGNYSYALTRTHGEQLPAARRCLRVHRPGVLLRRDAGHEQRLRRRRRGRCLPARPARRRAALRAFDRIVRRGSARFLVVHLPRDQSRRCATCSWRRAISLRMKEALLSLLAGDLFGGTPIWNSVRAFKIIYYFLAAASPPHAAALAPSPASTFAPAEAAMSAGDR